MKFRLTTSRKFYTPEDAAALHPLGFTFRPTTLPWDDIRSLTIIDRESQTEMGTLEDLMAFIAKWGKVVVSEDGIEIYNDYRE